MAHRKAAITMGVGVLSILSSVFILIMMGLAEGFCNLQDSCSYTIYEPAAIFAAGLFSIGGVLTLIGFVLGGAKEDDVSKQEGVQK